MKVRKSKQQSSTEENLAKNLQWFRETDEFTNIVTSAFSKVFTSLRS